MNSNVENLSSQDDIFQWWPSACLDICLGTTNKSCVFQLMRWLMFVNLLIKVVVMNCK